MIGGTAAISTALTTRSVPCRPMYRATSPPAGGMADQRRVADVEGFQDRGEVVGVAVHVVAGPGLAGPAVPAAVVRDRPVAVLGQEDHLAVPRVGAERPAVRERDDRALAPVLVKQFRAVVGPDSTHLRFSFSCSGAGRDNQKADLAADSRPLASLLAGPLRLPLPR